MLGFLTAIGLFIILMTLLFWYLNNKLALENPGSLQCLDDFRKKSELQGKPAFTCSLFGSSVQGTFYHLFFSLEHGCFKSQSALIHKFGLVSSMTHLWNTCNITVVTNVGPKEKRKHLLMISWKLNMKRQLNFMSLSPNHSPVFWLLRIISVINSPQVQSHK